MAKESVDTRKLKDEVTDLLKKQKWEKAADNLEKLIKLEPKDMQHRLRLGDAYRRMDQAGKAIGTYEFAAKFFGGEGQLIKAIAAVKMILELDSGNVEAQKQLAEMNQRRFGKPMPADPVSRPPAAKRTTAAGRAREAIELPDEEPPAAAPKAPEPELGGLRHETLELDQPAARRKVIVPPAEKKVYELGDPYAEIDLLAGTGAVRPNQEVAEVSDEDISEELPDEAILPPIPEDEDDVLEAEEVEPEPPPKPSRPPPQAKKPGRGITVSEEISVEEDPPARSALPIADLLSSDAEEEIELLSVSSDEEAAPRPAGEPEADDGEFDAAFGTIASGSRKQGEARLAAKKVPLFDDLSQEAFVELVNRLSYHQHAAGSLIIREGDPGWSFYVIVEGKVRVYKDGRDGNELTLAHLGEGAFFGEMALLSGAPRTANVVAEDDTAILEVTDVVLRDLAQRHPPVIQSLKNFYRQRLLNNVMAISPLFKDFDPTERKAIVEKFRMRQAANGEVIVAEGKVSDGLYVVLHGVVEVKARKNKEPIELARLKEGDIFGEMSLLTRNSAAATVTSVGNSILLRLPRESFQELVVTHPQILELVSELNERRKSAIAAVLKGPGQNGMSYA